MKYQVSKQFSKDSLKNTHYKSKLKETILQIEKAGSIADLKHCSKMKGYTGFYKIRIGDYRIAFELDESTIILRRFLHRKDIYKYFPPKR